jgi:hypothetical protein
MNDLGEDEEEPLEGDVAAAVVRCHEEVEEGGEEEDHRKQKIKHPLARRPISKKKT